MDEPIHKTDDEALRFIQRVPQKFLDLMNEAIRNGETFTLETTWTMGDIAHQGGGVKHSGERVPCPDCGGVGKISGTVPGVPASVCTKLSPCERCWPRNPDGTKKFWNDGTAGTLLAPPEEKGAPVD